mmetsp:Transcript_22350/g.54619  ORF Transcript_22350/g.54619 Transcript_22350/m.54619 type:complete len:131 (+) Transcript_22350:356-748(+)|eukprot:CAMPEP_0198328550 /NCGR_PEP_ID=MMETSP1450-20131203/15552_1 /TAXON_ID=753684 ORGANISM="Madagascaria erythrocladiodes, Strain CCMP3234" /NCGR_SAMPLE_ID=MMETSP1450 /ASSEMBLY_ACC=CAM_ASM_001115 /LENGTH=130 /DNA_ID=CAMNT_0044032693 /DNA_START=260 /DNA_END=652 /DNA_ORIENTATION=+
MAMLMQGDFSRQEQAKESVGREGEVHMGVQWKRMKDRLRVFYSMLGVALLLNLAVIFLIDDGQSFEDTNVQANGAAVIHRRRLMEIEVDRNEDWASLKGNGMLRWDWERLIESFGLGGVLGTHADVRKRV